MESWDKEHLKASYTKDHSWASKHLIPIPQSLHCQVEQLRGNGFIAWSDWYGGHILLWDGWVTNAEVKKYTSCSVPRDRRSMCWTVDFKKILLTPHHLQLSFQNALPEKVHESHLVAIKLTGQDRDSCLFFPKAGSVPQPWGHHLQPCGAAASSPHMGHSLAVLRKTS